MRSKPPATKASSRVKEVCSSTVQPKTLPPKASGETRRAEEPRGRLSMAGWYGERGSGRAGWPESGTADGGWRTNRAPDQVSVSLRSSPAGEHAPRLAAPAGAGITDSAPWAELPHPRLVVPSHP